MLMSVHEPARVVLRCVTVLCVLSALQSIARAQSAEGVINQIIQSPAPIPRTQTPFPLPSGDPIQVRTSPPVLGSRTADREEIDVNTVIRALSPRDVPPPVVMTLASGTFLGKLAVEARRWPSAALARLLPDQAISVSVTLLPVPDPLAVTWPFASQYGVVVTQTQIALIERASRRVAIVMDKATGVAIGPQARFIFIQDRQTSRTIVLDLHASFDQDVYFANNSSQLSGIAREQLLALGAALQSPALQGARFLISGHTNTIGSDIANRELSFRRAVAVREHLTRHFGLPSRQIEIYGFGADRLKYPDAPRHPGNRRVEIALVIGDAP